jgi:hypothetical protein
LVKKPLQKRFYQEINSILLTGKMFKSARKGQSLLVLLLLVVMLVQTSKADTVDFTAKDMMPAFLSEVVGLDLNKYNIINEEYSFKYPSEYGGNVKDEHVYLELVSSEGNISVMGLFLNGFNGGIFVYPPTNGPMFFKPQLSTNALDESRNILQRYKIFAENYGLETSHIDSALNLLNTATRAPSASDDLRTFNNIIGFVPSVTTAGNVKQETTQESVSWIYTEKGVDMPNKCLKIDFGINKLHFVDTWNLFTVGGFSVVSEDEVKQIAFDAANNYNLTLVGENDTLIVAEKPEWSNRISIVLNMVPGEIYNDELSKKIGIVSGGNATRDPMALYPLWETVLYFSERVGSVYGIAVGVWGDTTEIAYITPYGYLDAPPQDPDTTASPDTSADETEENPSEQTEPSSTQTEISAKLESSNPSSSMYLVAGIAAAATAVAMGAVILKKRRKMQNS